MRFEDLFTNAGTNDLNTYNNWYVSLNGSGINIVDSYLVNNYSLDSMYAHTTPCLLNTFSCEADMIINTLDASRIGVGMCLDDAPSVSGHYAVFMDDTKLAILKNGYGIYTSVAFTRALQTYRLKMEIIKSSASNLIRLYLDNVLKLTYVHNVTALDVKRCGVFFAEPYYNNRIDNFYINEMPVKYINDDGTGL